MRADTTGLRTNTVQRLLGRKPRTFAAWCARNSNSFREAAAAECRRAPCKRECRTLGLVSNT
jgi:hypothetical protein